MSNFKYNKIKIKNLRILYKEIEYMNSNECNWTSHNSKNATNYFQEVLCNVILFFLILPIYLQLR